MITVSPVCAIDATMKLTKEHSSPKQKELKDGKKRIEEPLPYYSKMGISIPNYIHLSKEALEILESQYEPIKSAYQGYGRTARRKKNDRA